MFLYLILFEKNIGKSIVGSLFSSSSSVLCVRQSFSPIAPMGISSDQIVSNAKPCHQLTSTNSQQTTTEKTWKIFYANVRGIKGKRSSLIENLDSENPHVVLLTETLLPTDTDIHIQGYKFFGRESIKKAEVLPF